MLGGASAVCVCLMVCCCRSPSPSPCRKKLRLGGLEQGFVCADQLELPRVSISHGVGPRAALKKLRFHEKSPSEKILWIEDARMSSILGSCQLSLPSVMSGLRCWIAFVGGYVFARVATGGLYISLLLQMQ